MKILFFFWENENTLCTFNEYKINDQYDNNVTSQKTNTIVELFVEICEF